MSINIIDVAKHLIYLSSTDTHSSLTPLKLQKLLYYAQGFSFAWDGKALFNEEFEAWQYGPVSRKIYYEYNRYRQSRIPYYEGKRLFVPIEAVETINAVWRDFKDLSAFELVNKTHGEDPWINAYNSNTVITSNAIKSYFIKAYK